MSRSRSTIKRKRRRSRQWRRHGSELGTGHPRDHTVRHAEKGRPVVNYLALSSGGDDGAFAAGVLVGWTRSGRRPHFEIVTGVSAGALIAPFAGIIVTIGRNAECRCENLHPRKFQVYV